MPDQVQDITMKTETGEVDPDHNLIFENNAAQIVTIPTEATQGHNTRIDVATTGAAHDAHAPPIEATAISLALTHHINHITDHPYIEVLQDLHRSSSHSSRPQGKPHLKKNQRVKIDDPHMDYYGSDDHSSDSGEESNDLN